MHDAILSVVPKFPYEVKVKSTEASVEFAVQVFISEAWHHYLVKIREERNRILNV